MARGDGEAQGDGIMTVKTLESLQRRHQQLKLALLVRCGSCALLSEL